MTVADLHLLPIIRPRGDRAGSRSPSLWRSRRPKRPRAPGMMDDRARYELFRREGSGRPMAFMSICRSSHASFFAAGLRRRYEG